MLKKTIIIAAAVFVAPVAATIVLGTIVAAQEAAFTIATGVAEKINKKIASK